MNDKLFKNYNFLGVSEDYSEEEEEQAVEANDDAQNGEQDPSQR